MQRAFLGWSSVYHGQVTCRFHFLVGRTCAALCLQIWHSSHPPAGELGDKLEKKAGKETKELGRLTFVPWVGVMWVGLGPFFKPYVFRGSVSALRCLLVRFSRLSTVRARREGAMPGAAWAGAMALGALLSATMPGVALSGATQRGPREGAVLGICLGMCSSEGVLCVGSLMPDGGTL